MINRATVFLIFAAVQFAGFLLLAAVGAGAFPDLASAAQRTLTRGALERPAPGAHESYEEPYRRFRAWYRAARPPVEGMAGA